MTEEYRTNATNYYIHADKLNEQQSEQHKELAGKISELEKFKTKWVYMIMGGVAVFGFISGHITAITNFLK